MRVYAVSFFFLNYRFYSSSSTRKKLYRQRASGQAAVTGVFPSSPRYMPSFLSHVGFRIPDFQLFLVFSLIFIELFSAPRALALSARQCFRYKKFLRK